METVEVVIRIKKNTFDAINELSKFVDSNHIINGYQMKGNSTVGSMITAIAKGTVLPKRHGRLIDADAYLANTPIRESAVDTWIKEVYVYMSIMDTPTIIEADTESDGKDGDSY